MCLCRISLALSHHRLSPPNIEANTFLTMAMETATIATARFNGCSWWPMRIYGVHDKRIFSLASTERVSLRSKGLVPFWRETKMRCTYFVSVLLVTSAITSSLHLLTECGHGIRHSFFSFYAVVTVALHFMRFAELIASSVCRRTSPSTTMNDTLILMFNTYFIVFHSLLYLGHYTRHEVCERAHHHLNIQQSDRYWLFLFSAKSVFSFYFYRFRFWLFRPDALHSLLIWPVIY